MIQMQWQPPFIAVAPVDSKDPPFVKYLGRGDDYEDIARFVYKYRFTQVLAFEPESIEDIFDGNHVQLFIKMQLSMF